MRGMSVVSFCLALWLTAFPFNAEPVVGQLVVEPAAVTLDGNFAQTQLVVREAASSEQLSSSSLDLTGQVQYDSSDPSIATVNATGRVLARADGETRIVIRHGETSQQVPVTVRGVVSAPAVDYFDLVSPVISKAGCNQGACHASQHGKGGFRLSVFAFAPDEDYKQLVRDQLQRRVNVISPQDSLILLKATARVPHGGGRRLAADSTDYEILKAWVAAGTPAPAKTPPPIARLLVTPARRVAEEGQQQQLRVEAVYADGRQRDVTAWAKFDSMDDGALRVTSDGLVTTQGRGQAAIMVRFEGQAEISLFTIPYPRSAQLSDWTNQNAIDELASAKFRQLGIEPSPLCDDATFVRRAFLDCIGSLPSLEETEAFLQDGDSEKRRKLIDRLLGLTGDPQQDIYIDRYAAYWTLKWADLIRNNSNDLGEQGMWALHNWLQQSFRTNMPFDQFVRELVTAKGSVYSNGPANYFLVNNDPTALTEATSQLFLGVRLECAKCHHHPFEKYSQEDYYQFAAFFARVGLKNSEEFGIFGRERVVVVKESGEVTHPRTRARMEPQPLDGDTMDHPLDRRLPLAQWLTSAENPFFARSVVNRYMAYLLGRGLVEPVDDMRSTNPPSNPELMDLLAREFIDSGYNARHLIRLIMNSRLYQLDSQPTPANAADSRFYSHYYVKRLAAEPLLDAVDRVTLSPTKHRNLPSGTLAIELPDAEYPNYFLTTFAKPRRASVCECERSADPNLAQALHTLNGDILTEKIADKNGRIAQLLKSEIPPEEAIRQIYLAALSRPPRPEELSACQQFIEQAPSPQEGFEDLLWALLNTKDFLFVH